MNVIYHVLGTFEGINCNLFFFILFQIWHRKVCDLLILICFELVCIGVGSRILEMSKRRWSHLFIEYREFVLIILLL